jgi:hypothetical protein
LFRDRNEATTVFLVVLIVCEDVILLGINDSFNDLTGMITFINQYRGDNVHNNGTHSRETHKDTLDNAASDLLKLTVDVGEEVEGGFAKLFKLGLDQVVEHIN